MLEITICEDGFWKIRNTETGRVLASYVKVNEDDFDFFDVFKVAKREVNKMKKNT